MANELYDLELLATIGFEGHASNTLRCHPDWNHILYALGSTIVVENLGNHKQTFLNGHNNSVSCLAVSPSGRYVASGQVTFMGFKADVILWDFATRSVIKRFSLHKVKVEQVAFSPNEKYLVSLGSQDDRSVVVWDLETHEAICGAAAALSSAGLVTCLKYSNHSDDTFITGGDCNLRVWTLDRKNRKIKPEDIDTQKIKRQYLCIEVESEDKHFFAGTLSGDVLMVNLQGDKKNPGRFPQKNLFSLGVSSLALLANGHLLVGAGDGTVAEMKPGAKGDIMGKVKSVKVDGGVTSLCLRKKGHQFFVGTSACNVYKFVYPDLSFEAIVTSHTDEVRDVCFPSQSSALFVTCSKEDIRVWSTETNRELLRIKVANMWCNGICIKEPGDLIISGWSDKTIKAFAPQSGKMCWEIASAHIHEVTAVAVTNDGRRVISGGGEGTVKVWNIANASKQVFEQALKEHRGKITAIKLKMDDRECISASTDGSCIVWNLETFTRSVMLQASSLFECVCYHPREFQVITSGSDRKIGYWEVTTSGDNHPIREVEAAAAGNINGMDVGPFSFGSHENYIFVTCGGDKLVKLWLYNEAIVTHCGKGHSTDIMAIKFSPDLKYIVSVGADGSILRWKVPPNMDALVDKTHQMQMTAD
ncbi:cilia- and flagella-associated protein 52-like [Symsagittifera roscoffensis]|uniref:cilia- and flagella-associated protein 52-like n=1 Tax=Symsagittifera roscoffensis TaxID=84072 RepID=UPI00307CBF05